MTVQDILISFRNGKLLFCSINVFGITLQYEPVIKYLWLTPLSAKI